MEALGFGAAAASYLAGMDPRRASAVRSRLEDWCRWCSENGVDLNDPGAAAVECYGRWLREALGRSRATQRAAMAQVCGAYRRGCADGSLPSDPTPQVRLPRMAGRSQGTYLTREQAAAFLDAASRERDRAAYPLCLLLLLSGPRISEALGLDVGDLRLSSDPPLASLRRKGDWTQAVRLPSRTAEALRGLLGDRAEGPAFRFRGKRYPYHRASAIVARCGEAAGADGITPHSLRRTFCTLSRDAGIPDRDIMASAGWSSPHMLDYYDMGRRAAKAAVGDALDGYISGLRR